MCLDINLPTHSFQIEKQCNKSQQTKQPRNNTFTHTLYYQKLVGLLYLLDPRNIDSKPLGTRVHRRST